MPGTASSLRPRRGAIGLALAGLVVLAVSFLVSGSGWADFPPSTVLTAERLLPLVGLGMLLGQLPRRAAALSVTLLLAGAFLGVAFRERAFELMAPVPGAAAHMFLTGPLACILIGVPLVLSLGLRPWLAVPLCALAGAALAIATLLADPTLHASSYLPATFAAQVWLVAALAAIVAAFDRPWLSVATRIFASWLVAIGLLYGGAHLAARRIALEPPPFPTLPLEDDEAGFSPILEQLDETGGAR
ncbi:hypothetical protein HHL25_11575 [Rhizobium sp. S-51]|uniref:Uncharacterized protein n=1 Tax=Rhizobium terricola TaxID=2728849 RepID=A0A7Y0AWP3_9HYPH|nr:hypothetical protein [Rhizobium terricola]NML74765.1 hypothetical protein [Rhizobium terricola]